MALTIRMRIDENDEHSYYYATGSGGEIELIPLVVDENGVFVPDSGKAYNRVTVNVPELDLETLIVDANGTYNAPDGKAYNVVTVNVPALEPYLQTKSVSYSANGTYSVSADSGYDGLETVSVAVNVPTPSPRLQSKSVSYDENGTYNVTPSAGYDGLSSVSIEVDVPSGGGSTDIDYAVVDLTDGVGGLRQLVEIRQNETPLAIYVVNNSPDYAQIPDNNILTQYSADYNPMGGVPYDMQVNVAMLDSTQQMTTDYAQNLQLDMVSPIGTAMIDAICVDNGYICGYVLDANSTGEYGLNGIYGIVVIYAMDIPV